MLRKKINLMLMIGWMIIIFIFSNEPGNISNENNKFVIHFLREINIDLNQDFGNLADFIVRKSAHFSEYFILYIFSFRVMQDNSKKNRYNFIYALSIVFLYACTDEFHQLFVPGREGRVRDVIIDTMGGMTAMLVLYIISTFKRNTNHN